MNLKHFAWTIFLVALEVVAVVEAVTVAVAVVAVLVVMVVAIVVTVVAAVLVVVEGVAAVTAVVAVVVELTEAAVAEAWVLPTTTMCSQPTSSALCRPWLLLQARGRWLRVGVAARCHLRCGLMPCVRGQSALTSCAPGAVMLGTLWALVVSAERGSSCCVFNCWALSN